MFTFLHAADIHLDSPLIGLTRYGDAPVDELRGASRRALHNLVDVALAERVAFVVLAGDLYDGDWKDYNTGLFFVQEMARLKEVGIPVFVLAGNHDAANQFTRSLRSPDNVKRFSTSRAETLLLDDYEVAIHGRGFPTKAVDEDLSAGYPALVPGRFNVGLLHTSLDGREGHAPYAPCSLNGLRSKHYQYWALGHVHTREEVCRDPWVVFPGNIQGRHARETGPKGCTLVTVSAGEVADVRQVFVDVLRWSRCRVDLSGAANWEVVLDRVGRALEREMTAAEGRLLALRLELCGRTAAHAACVAHPEHAEQELRALAFDRCGVSAWIERVEINTLPETRAGVHVEVSEALRGLLGTLGQKEGDDVLIAELTKEFSEIRGKLPVELFGPQAADPLDPTSPELLRGVVDQARDLLTARLTAEGK
jgi:DNA repair exonuclease SbcCD nuclease subunit